MAQAIERLYRLRVDASQANRQLTKISRNTNKIASGFGAVQRAAAAAFSVIGAVKGLTGLTKASDQLELLEGSFVALTGSSQRAANMVERVFRTVADTGASLEDTSSTFQRLTIGFQELGGTNAQIDAVANTFIKLGRISGTAMFDTNAALIQFSQGLASGKLQGDELRSIMERLPLITRLIADEYSRVNDNMVVTRGMVKQLGREGKISAEIMGNALLRASEDIATKFSMLVFTLEQEINSLKSTFTQVLADLSQKSGIGDALKTGIRGANRALKDFNRNVGVFAEDMVTMWRTSVLARNILIPLAVVIGYNLVVAITKATAAMIAFTRSNPLTALATLTAVAVLLIIKNWDKLKPFFLYEVPSWFSILESKWYDFLGSMEVGVKNLWRDIKIYFAEGINDVIGVLNTASAIFNSMGVIGPDIGFISTIQIDTAADAISSFGDESAAALTKAADYAAKYALAMSKVGVETEKAADEMKLFGKGDNAIASLGDEKALEKLAKAMVTLRDKVLNTLDPLRELELSLDELHTLMTLNILSESQVNAYMDAMDGTKEATEKAAEAAQKATQAWQDYAQSVKDAIDPMQVLIRKFDEVDMAVEKGMFSEEFGERYKNMLFDMHDAADKSTDKIIGALERIKDATDGFARDFTNTLVEGLKTGELAFDDFAASILETMAKIVLNSIFEQFFAMVTGSIIGGINSWGTGSKPTMSMGGSTGSVGVLGTSTVQSTAPKVKITVNNNAPVEVETTSSQNPMGGIDINMIIENKVNKAISNGGMDKVLKTSFGLSRRGF